jgi:pSer/pThr/pTyr-binding forkhead associated (FHA) protein
VSRSGTVLGRHTGADVRLLLPDISRQHCRFVFTGGHWQVIDLHSLNGVFLNDVRIQQAPLRHRDRLRIGNCTLEVDLLGEQVAAPKSASREDNTAAVLRQIVTSLLLPVPSRRAS